MVKNLFFQYTFFFGFFAFGATLSAQTNWQEFKSYEGKFRIASPAKFTEKIDSVTTSVGTLVYHTFFYQNPDEQADNLFYMVSYCDYPDFSMHSDSTALLSDFFQTTMETAAESVEGELIYASDVNLEEYPGKFWRIEYLENRVVIKTQAFLIRQRYYAIQTIALKERSINEATPKFFDSFRVF